MYSAIFTTSQAKCCAFWPSTVISRPTYLPLRQLWQGTDTMGSDMDLCILAPDRSQVIAAISHSRFERPLQRVVVNGQELAAMKRKDPAFYAQVQRGIVLWETIDESVP